MNALTCGSLFGGAGLLDCGLHQAGIQHAWVCESDPFRRGLLAARFPGAVIYPDIRNLRGDDMPRLTDEQFAWACGMYEAGQSVEQIAAELPVTRSALWCRMKTARIEMRPQARYGDENHFHRGGVFGEDWAHNKVEYAIRTGTLIRPGNCSECGGAGAPYKDGRATIHAHHDDYNKPLDVRWLCQPCHHEWHKHNAPVPRVGGDANGSPPAEPVDLIAGGFPLGRAAEPPAPANNRGSATPKLFCGTRCAASLGRFTPATFSSRTFGTPCPLLLDQGSLLEPSGESYWPTWPRSGSMSSGIVYPLQPSAPRTSVTASTPLLPTPRANDGSRPSMRRSSPGRSDTVGQAVERLLPTPRASERENRQTRRTPSQEAGTHGLSLLAETVSLLPTPKASADKHRRSPADALRKDPAIETVVWNLPLLLTPHGMAKEGQARRAGPTGNELGHALTTQLPSTGATTSPPSPAGRPSTGLRLNPSFVEWMMGTPTCSECGRGWTDPDCPHSATAFTSMSHGSSASRSSTTPSTAPGDDDACPETTTTATKGGRR